MKISEVRIKLMENAGDRLQAFCSVTIDGMFVVRDLKIIDGTRGAFVAMPSRKLTDKCPRCSSKNELRARYCDQCSVALDPDRAQRDSSGRARLYADIAHPINSRCREMIQNRVIEEFEAEKVRAEDPGYKCHYDDFDEEQFAALANDTLDDGEPRESKPIESATTTTIGLENESAPESEPEIAESEITEPKPDESHRIEPAADRNAPHHDTLPARESVKQTIGDGSSIDFDDVFGIGID